MIEIRDLGMMPYKEAWGLQHSLFDRMVTLKKEGSKPDKEYILMVEHPPVVTLGKHAKRENVLLPREMLAGRGIEVYEIERGGDVTYHAPGQLVVYPILDLEKHGIGVKEYVHRLEEAVIKVISEFGIRGERIEGASGVWIGKWSPAERKICAVGVKCSRFCTMHGLALNVNNDPEGFRIINPCGFIDKGVTSIAKEIGREVDIEKVKESLAGELNALFPLYTLSQGKP